MTKLTADQLLIKIKIILKGRNINKKIEPNSEIARLGIDSLELLNLVIKIEQTLKLKLNDHELLKIKTIGDLINLIIKTQTQ